MFRQGTGKTGRAINHEGKGKQTMKFKYVEHDPMDTVPASPLKMFLTGVACIAYMAFYLVIWCAILGWRP